MNTARILNFVRESGVSIRLTQSGKLRLRGKPDAVASVKDAVIQHKAEIIELLRREPLTDAAGFSLEIPDHVRRLLHEGQYGPDQFPDWTPETCAEFLRGREKEFHGAFQVRGYLGLRMPDDWEPHIRIAFQSVYVRSLQKPDEDPPR